MEVVRFLGITVHALTTEQLTAWVVKAVEERRKVIVGNHNLHSVYLYYHHPRFRAFCDAASVIHVDGMSLVLLAKLLGVPLRAEHRTTYVDWIVPLMQTAAQKGYRVFHLGGRPGVGEKAAGVLRRSAPGLQIQTHHGYFDTKGPENEAVLYILADYQPHILMVGMGMPRQEAWILDNIQALPTHVILNSGACFDFVAGVVPMPPRWMGRLGLEWLYRLLSEPRRLWKRYLVEPFYLTGLVAAEFLSRRLAHRPEVKDQAR
ncbi:MAG: WecB/TagA/CpsF family glycosyltransferase [Desulfosoma sp.]|uniref:WecB/TagA/CpsF family glycosyltransferase n=1 Tax=Desulfosoma sp. TaxID=2603217 RepID=UPI004049CEE1